MRVKVWDGFGREYIGEGELIGRVNTYTFAMTDHGLFTWKDPEVLPPIEVINEMLEQGASLRKLKDNPKILMDDGKILYGSQCWWRKDEPTEQKENPPA